MILRPSRRAHASASTQARSASAGSRLSTRSRTAPPTTYTPAGGSFARCGKRRRSWSRIRFLFILSAGGGLGGSEGSNRGAAGNRFERHLPMPSVAPSLPPTPALAQGELPNIIAEAANPFDRHFDD